VSQPTSVPLNVTVAVVSDLYYVLLSQVILIGFLLYNYVLFFETDKIVGGTIGIVSALLAIVGPCLARCSLSRLTRLVAATKIPLAPSGKSVVALGAFRTRQEGRIAIVTNVG